MQLQLKLEKGEIDRLKDLDNHKNKLYTNISHEFRTPLTLLTAPLKKQLQSQILPDETRSDLQLIDRNASQLLHLFDQLLDLSKLESSSIKLQVHEGRIDLLLKSVSESFALLAKQKKLEFSSKIPKLKKVWFDSDVIEKIVNNLLSNAIKYTSPEGNIFFEAHIDKKGVMNLTFINSIDGIKETDLTKIFDRFFQIDSSAEGSGIGLSLVKELVQLSHGTIEASYIDTKKIKFSILLPIRKEAFSNDELGQTDLKISTETEEVLAKSPNKNNSNIPIILVVEDNSDMRKFIKSLFQNDYKVMEATNGLEGIEKALKIIPDIIVSDVMMPIKNGIELCKTLKEDEKTSHIPIILLTAKSGDDHEIIGLNIGADDYITKPFNSRKLQVKVKKLIELRQKLRSRYRQDIFLAPKDIAVTNTDEKFFKRVEDILAKHLTDPTFNAESFSKLISMSRMQLHRKLTALTNLSTTAFIRSQRLKLAVKILKTSDANTSEAAYSSGFNSPSYFIKCFKEVYGKTPSEHLE
jgi:DNA-binding response OmpR family regulator